MWGAIGLRLLPLLGSVFNFVKSHPILTLSAAGIGGTTLLAGRNKDEQPTQQPTQQPAQQGQPTQQEQPTQKSKSTQKSQPKHKSSSSGGKGTVNLPPLESLFSQQEGVNLPQNYSSSNQELTLSQIANQLQELFLDLDKHRQMYEVLTQQYLQANEIYEKQLLKTMQIIPFLIAKTPLSNITTEDLNEHLNNLFTSMPYTDAIEKVNQVAKGYYIAKMNGVDPKTLSTTDLIMIADNPTLAQSVNDNIVKFLEQMGEILKYKIESNMGKIGALKDQYQNILKELEEKGKLYKELIDAIKAKTKEEFDVYKFNTRLAFDEYKFNKRLAFDEYKFNKKEELKKKKLKVKKMKTIYHIYSVKLHHKNVKERM